MREYYGRRRIKTDISDITAENVMQVLYDSKIIHDRNVIEIAGLWDIYKGKTDIRDKTKEFRENINNIICENRAMQIVEFYQGYIFGEPIQYVRNSENEELSDEVLWLNKVMMEKDKVSLDDELSENMMVCGVCPRLILPSDSDKEVFSLYTLDPRYAYNVYHNGLGNPVVMSVSYVVHDDLTISYDVYTKDMHYKIENDSIVSQKPHILRKPPIVEYCLNNARIGIFEPVITLLSAIDTLQSNRLDDVQQFVNSILAVLGAELTDETLERLAEYGALSLPQGTDAKYLSATLSQGDIQTLKNDFITAITEITGMPNRNGGSSTSDTGSAVLLRDGWEIADAKSKRIENQFKKAERQMLESALYIASGIANKSLKVGDIEIRFTRRNYEGIQTKATVLTTMLNNSHIHPELAFSHCGMFPDPGLAYQMSEEYYERSKENAQNNNREEETARGSDNQEGNKEGNLEEDRE